MKLEEAINQKKFKNEWQKATINIIYTYSWMTTHIRAFLKTYGVTLQQYNVLRILRGAHPKPISTSTIRERMMDKMSDASRIVDRLEKKGLIIKQICTHDRRLVDILISPKGLDLLAEVDKEGEKLEVGRSVLSETEAMLLNNLLDKLRT